MFSIRKILIGLLFSSPILVFSVFGSNRPLQVMEISDKSGATASMRLPADWKMDTERGKNIGIELIAQPDQEKVEKSAEKIYLNLVDNSSGVAEEEFVNNDVEEFKKIHSDLQVTEGSPLGESKAIVRIFESKADGIYESVAYIKLDKGFAIIAHTAPDAITLSKHRHIFTTAVKSFIFKDKN